MTDTDPTLALIPELHAVARSSGQKTWSRRSIDITAVVLVHAVFFLILFISRFAPPPDEIVPPMEAVLLLNQGKQNATSTAAPPEKEIPRPSGPPLTHAITLPPPRARTQEEMDQDLLGGLARALACEAGQYEYLAPSARAKCAEILVPWKLDRAQMEASRFKPTDPNTVPLHLDAADSARRVNETSSGCVPGASGPANDACQLLHPAGVPVKTPGGFKF